MAVYQYENAIVTLEDGSRPSPIVSVAQAGAV